MNFPKLSLYIYIYIGTIWGNSSTSSNLKLRHLSENLK